MRAPPISSWYPRGLRPRSLLWRRVRCVAPLLACLCLLPASARAFCRTTTCDPAERNDCVLNRQGCETRGEPVFWPDACVTYAVQANGSPLRGISAAETDEAMKKAFAAWLGAECPGGGHPSLGVVPLGGANCDQAEFNTPDDGRPLSPNANLIIYRDGSWPYTTKQFVIARTSITFNPRTGAIYDADIEVNSFENEFSVSDTQVSNDLQSVLTHEVGHFLGLDHTLVPNSTMLADYELSNLGTRTLGSDDRAGICSVYAPQPDAEPGCPANTAPHHLYSRECGTTLHADASCLSLGGSAPRGGPSWLLWAGLLALGVLRRQGPRVCGSQRS